MNTAYRALIDAKKSGRSFSREQIFSFARAVAEGQWPDYQIAALLMAIRLKGMSAQETAHLTMAMAQHSERLDKARMGRFAVDKHSTGGVGDGISLVLAPLAASLGLSVPMMSGRSLGLTGGTLDKLESVPGFNTRISKPEIERQMSRLGVAMFGQSNGMAPVDKKLYALRDAIGAVDSMPLVVSSIVSKKLAEGLRGIVFDVKFGRGAIFKNRAEASRLARELVRVSRASGLRAQAVLSRMEEPLGRAVGNSVEMEQAVRILSGQLSGVEDFLQVTRELLFYMFKLAGSALSREELERRFHRALLDGSAMAKFEAMLKAQGVAAETAKDPLRHLPQPSKFWEIQSPVSGWVAFVDARLAAEATLHLGALRRQISDSVDFTAGVRLLKKSGERVEKGESLAALQTSRAPAQECRIAGELMRKAFVISKAKKHKPSLIVKSGF